MGYGATISFKLAPDYYAVVKAMAAGRGKSVSQFVRETLEEALDLDAQSDRLVTVFLEVDAALDELAEQNRRL